MSTLRKAPKPGLLTSMALTYGTAAVAVVIALFVPEWHHIFAARPPAPLMNLMLISVGLLGLHKVESWLTREFEVCPVYCRLADAPWATDVRRTAFVVFCSLVVAFLVLIALVLRGAPWALLLLFAWSAQGLHELHHLAKCVARRSYYSGTLTAILFVAFMSVLFTPGLVGLLQPVPSGWVWVFVGLHPVLLGIFYWEDRVWLSRRRAQLQGVPRAPQPIRAPKAG